MEKTMKKGISIRITLSILAIVFMSGITIVIATIGYELYHASVLNNYITYTDTVLEYAYRAAEEYSFGDMIAKREMPQEYELLRSELNKVKDCSDIEYLYAIYFDDIDDLNSLCYAINAKTTEELSQGLPLSEIYTYMGKSGSEDGFAQETLEIFQNALKTKKRDNGFVEGYSVEYGYQLNGYRVLFDSADNPAGILCVEININTIKEEINIYIRKGVVIAVLLTVLVVIIYLLLTQKYLVGPIERITKSSNSFVKKLQSDVDPGDLKYEDAHVKSGGELGVLAYDVNNLADSVAAYMINLKKITSERERLGAELSLATEIQEGMLPSIFPAFPDRHDMDIYAKMKPAREVGGDFYDFFLVDDDHLCMVMADVSGKGVPAALFMMASKIILQNHAMMGKTPEQILTDANTSICNNNKMRMFVTVWLGILELSTGKLTAANAGHEYPAIKHDNGKFELLKDKHGFVLGGMEDVRYKGYELSLSPGDKFFIYTDGVPEATDAQNNMFGVERMIDALNTDGGATPIQTIENVQHAVDEFVQNAEQFDDLTMLCVEYKGR